MMSIFGLLLLCLVGIDAVFSVVMLSISLLRYTRHAIKLIIWKYDVIHKTIKNTVIYRNAARGGPQSQSIW